MSSSIFSYEIRPRKQGGWMLLLLEDGAEVGGGIAPDYDDLYAEAELWIESRARPSPIAEKLRQRRARGSKSATDDEASQESCPCPPRRGRKAAGGDQ